MAAEESQAQSKDSQPFAWAFFAKHSLEHSLQNTNILSLVFWQCLFDYHCQILFKVFFQRFAPSILFKDIFLRYVSKIRSEDLRKRCFSKICFKDSCSKTCKETWTPASKQVHPCWLACAKRFRSKICSRFKLFHDLVETSLAKNKLEPCIAILSAAILIATCRQMLDKF